MTDTNTNKKDGGQYKAPNSKANPNKRNNKNKRDKRNSNKKGNKNQSNVPKWKGSKSDLNGHVFECPDEPHSKPNQYTLTVDEMIKYVKTEFDYGNDAAYILQNDELPDLVEPPAPSDETNRVQVFHWEQQYKRYDIRLQALTETQSKLYSLILGQCSKKLIGKLETMMEYQEICASQTECITLLSLI